MTEITTTLAYLSNAQLYTELRRRNLPVPSVGTPATLADAMLPAAAMDMCVIQTGKDWELFATSVMASVINRALEASGDGEWVCVIYAYDTNGPLSNVGTDAVVCYRGAVVRMINDRTIVFATGETVHIDSVIAVNV